MNNEQKGKEAGQYRKKKKYILKGGEKFPYIFFYVLYSFSHNFRAPLIHARPFMNNMKKIAMYQCNVFLCFLCFFLCCFMLWDCMWRDSLFLTHTPNRFALVQHRRNAETSLTSYSRCCCSRGKHFHSHLDTFVSSRRSLTRSSSFSVFSHS